AVDAAVRAMGRDAVAASLPLLQPLALPIDLRRRVRQQKELLTDLRHAVQQATGATDAHLARLERIRPRTLLVIVGSTIAFYSLLPQLGNLGDTAEALRTANVLWLAVLLAASVLTYVFATVSFLGSVPQSLPVAPTLRAQVAASFATLVGPGSSGSLALEVRFLQRSGVRGPEATAAVALNTVAGTVVHVVLLFGFVVWTGKSGVQRFSLPDTNIVLLVLAVLASLVGLALLVRPLRQRILVPAVRAARTGLAQIGRVFRSPARVIALFGGSAALTLAYIAGLMAAVAAFGGELTFPQVGTAYLAATAIAALAPTPGGLGAVESALIAALTGYGLGDGVAVSAVLTFRLATFWLPILPGWLLFGWMQRHSEL
ncbi:MAG TPA: lysylphosphatidylglycerol synthase transmembrane domain-containing protein, partial [Acidimicrobiales bacterium]